MSHDPFSRPGDTRQTAMPLLADGSGTDYVPAAWQGNPLKWLAQTSPEYRRKRFLEDHPQTKPEPQKPRAYAPRFSTDYAIAWGRKQGWTLIDRERYDARTKRHHDLQLGVDALFDTPDGMVGVQGAGRHERKAHYERFMARGGIEKSQRRKIRVVYLEFERGDKTPAMEEWWS